MESPKSWDSLTASLAVSDLERPCAAWAFLVVQNLVRDRLDDRRTFIEILRHEKSLGPITGPSLEARVARRLSAIGIGLPAGQVADPDALIATARLELINSWQIDVIGDH